MGKYVCDYETVNTIANGIGELADIMEKSLLAYKTSIDEKLSGWNGNAKTAFAASNNRKLQTLITQVNEIRELAIFTKNASAAIESTDTELATYSI